MKHIKQILLISTCCLLSNVSNAEINLTFDNADFTSSNPTLHTHHTPNVELKPILPFYSGVKFAAVCALAGGGCDDISFNLDNASQCQETGFVTSCPSGYVPDENNRCPYNNSFFKCRVCSHTCNSGSLTYCNSNLIKLRLVQLTMNVTKLVTLVGIKLVKKGDMLLQLTLVKKLQL